MRPGVPIPYSGSHIGPRRLLTLTLHSGGLGAGGAHVTNDGSTHVLPWGSAVFEVPADRPVVISVYQIAQATVGLATTTLMPHDPPALEYQSPRLGGLPGEIGPPGTTRARGGCCLFALFAMPVTIGLVFMLAVAMGA